MTRLDTLRSLQQRIREATGPDRELDGDIIVAFKGGEIVWKTTNYTMEQYPAHRHPSKHHLGGFANEHVPILTASLDACDALQRTVLPGSSWARTKNGSIHVYRAAGALLPIGFPEIGESCANDCLTFLDAIFSAVIAKEEAKHTEKAG